MSHNNTNCVSTCKECLCNTCANDHATCCSVEHDDINCPFLYCEDYEKEGE